MKKNTPLTIIVFIVVGAFLAYTFSQSTKQAAIYVPFGSPMPAHQVDQLKGWKVKWQVFNPVITSLQANNGKVFYMGTLGDEHINRIIALNAADGSLAMKTEPIETDVEFIADESALYIGKSLYEIYKYDMATQKQVWTQEFGNSHSPCCFSLVNHQLQSQWYPYRFYIQSTEDGKIIQEMKDTQTKIYRIEAGITYGGTSSGHLIAQNADHSVLWKTKLQPFLQPLFLTPVFTQDAIYVWVGERNGIGTGIVYALDRASGKIRWQTARDVISNVAVSDKSVFYLTLDRVLGLNASTGEIEKSALIIPSDLSPTTEAPGPYQVAYDEKTQTLVISLKYSHQMIALTE